MLGDPYYGTITDDNNPNKMNNISAVIWGGGKLGISIDSMSKKWMYDRDMGFVLEYQQFYDLIYLHEVAHKLGKVHNDEVDYNWQIWNNCIK